jgi:hypothetical protein
MNTSRRLKERRRTISSMRSYKLLSWGKLKYFAAHSLTKLKWNLNVLEWSLLNYLTRKLITFIKCRNFWHPE